jgi:hypothetical protein
MQKLVDEGWTPEVANGGHIKLSHENAPHPVFASKTPSNSGSRFNIQADARRALRMGRADILSTTMQATATVPEAPKAAFEPPASLRKKKRWTAGQHAAARAKAADPLVVPSSDAPMNRAARRSAPKAPLDPANIAKVPEQATSKVAAPNAPTAPQRASTTEAAPIASPAGCQTISADILTLAMRLLSGDLARIEITEKMVGMTLFHEGDVHLVDGDLSGLMPAAPAAPSIPDPMPLATEAPVSETPVAKTTAVETKVAETPVVKKKARAKEGRSARLAMRRDLLRTALAVDPEAWLTHIDVADLVAQDAGYTTRKSLLVCVQGMLGSLCKAGEVELRREGGCEYYRAKSR